MGHSHRKFALKSFDKIYREKFDGNRYFFYGNKVCSYNQSILFVLAFIHSVANKNGN